MRFPTAPRMGVLAAALCLCAQGQPLPGKDAAGEIKGLPPRATPADYPAQAKAGALTIAADFRAHTIPTPQGNLTTEDYIVVETGLYGASGARITISSGDFALRVNGKKNLLPSQPFGLVIASVKDPEWEPPEPPKSKSKTSLGGGGGEQRDSSEPPPPVKIPIPVQRAMAQRVQKAALAEGDRALPQAGLLFFPYRGKSESIHSVELLYTGPAGKAVLKMQR